MSQRAERSARPRLTLGELTLADETEFLEAVRRSRRLHGRWVSPPTAPESFRTLVRYMGDPVNRGYLVRRADTQAMVGLIQLTNIVRGPFRSAYLGYFAFSGHAGLGLMSEALRQVMRHAFGPLKLHRLEANIQPENTVSIALVRACGFRKEGYSPRYLKIRGRWRDHERWAALADDRRLSAPT